MARGRIRCEVMHRLEWVEVGPGRNNRLIDLGWRAGGQVRRGGPGTRRGAPMVMPPSITLSSLAPF